MFLMHFFSFPPLNLSFPPFPPTLLTTIVSSNIYSPAAIAKIYLMAAGGIQAGAGRVHQHQAGGHGRPLDQDGGHS